MTVPHWDFRDYISRGGRNYFQEWLDDQPLKVQLEINTRLEYLRYQPPPLQRPYTARLKGECDGLYELRVKVEKVQYRPLFFYGPGKSQITFLAGAIEKGGKLQPPDVCQTALERRDQIGKGATTCEHAF